MSVFSSLGNIEFIPPPFYTLAGAALTLFLLWYLYSCLRTKRFYIVRHGETTLNAKRIRQGSEGGLSDRGKHQAEKLGAALARLPVRRMYASPFERTVETTILINNAFSHPRRVVYTPLLAERRSPSAIIGKSRDDPEVKRITALIDFSYHGDTIRHSDEENFIDLKRRAHRCLRFLEHQRGHCFVVITHSVFLRMLLSYMLFRGHLHVPQYVKLSFLNPPESGAVSVCEYRPLMRWFTKTRGWTVVGFNEPLSVPQFGSPPPGAIETPPQAAASVSQTQP